MLYIIATPIGNIKEITLRALDVLNAVDVIAAEDTRHTAVLLNEYTIKKPLISYQKFNERASAEKLVGYLAEGKDVALVSDAGMPLISDPGSVLLREVIARGLDYTVVSGPCALVNALVLSGLPTENFCMVGFLPEKKIDRKRLIDKFARLTCTLVFYTPPHNVEDDLAFLYEALGARRVAVVREISKLHEEVIRGVLGQPFSFTVKGEMVLVVEGAPETGEVLTERLTLEEHIRHYIGIGLDKKAAVKQVAADRKIAKSVVYAAALDME